MLFFKLTTLFLCFYYSQGYRIFIFNPIFGHSHVKFMSKIADVLAEAGHDVVGSRREIVAWTSNSKPQRIRALIFLPTLYQNDKRKKFNWNLFHCVGGTFPIYREKYWSFLSFSRPSTSQSWTSCIETRRVSPIRKLRWALVRQDSRFRWCSRKSFWTPSQKSPKCWAMRITQTWRLCGQVERVSGTFLRISLQTAPTQWQCCQKCTTLRYVSKRPVRVSKQKILKMFLSFVNNYFISYKKKYWCIINSGNPDKTHG